MSLNYIEEIPIDCIITICKYLSDFAKLNFLSVSKRHAHRLKKYIYFHEKVYCDLISHLDYYDMFVNIWCDSIIKFPSCIKRITFGKCFNQDIKSVIPSNVTHLTFGHNFNQDIKSAIPTSVTHLFFGYRFNQDITKNNIPINVQYVTSWNKNIKINIPSTIIQETDFKIMVRLLHH